MRKLAPIVAAFTTSLASSFYACADETAEPVVGPPAADVASPRVHAPLVREAGGYAVYQADMATLQSTEFGSLEDLDNALSLVASHQPQRLSRAWLAYAGLVAAQSPQFVDGVRQTADYYSRDRVLAGLGNDPAYASQITGASAARGALAGTIRSDARRVAAAAESIKQRSYSLQSTTWASSRAGDASERIGRMETAALTPPSVSAVTLADIAAPGALGSDTSLEERNLGLSQFRRAFQLGAQSAVATSPVLNAGGRGHARDNDRAFEIALTLAAYEALGETSAEQSPDFSPLLSETETLSCLQMARLHFHQCIAATHFRYEDPFCIAEHGLNDVGACFNAAAR